MRDTGRRPREQTTRARPAVLASEAALDRIAEAVGYPDRFAHREVGESPIAHRARAVSNALIYDNEELCGMGLGTGLPISFTRAREADGATQEFSPADRAAAEGRIRLPADATGLDAPLFDEPQLDTSYHWRLPSLARYGTALAAAGEPVPFLALTAFVIAVAAFVLAFFALVS